jgi:hypothetical protein
MPAAKRPNFWREKFYWIFRGAHFLDETSFWQNNHNKKRKAKV